MANIKNRRQGKRRDGKVKIYCQGVVSAFGQKVQRTFVEKDKYYTCNVLLLFTLIYVSNEYNFMNSIILKLG